MIRNGYLASLCLMAAFATPVAGEELTFNKHIAPLVFKQCATCHRPGEVAPFSLLSYADVKKRAEQIQTVTAQGIMPPWKSVAGHGSFIDERRLTKEQVELIARWAQAGAAEGRAEDLPEPPKFREGWKLGPPDIVLTMAEPYDVPAEGNDIYRNFVYALDVPKGKYIKSVEYRPGNRRVVHHAALSVDSSGVARKQDEADPAPGFKGSLNLPGQLLPGSLSAWTPGRDPLPLPEGLSMPWRAGADLVMQLHLHPSGKPETEQSSVGIYLTGEAPLRSMVDMVLVDRKIDIPPGEAVYRTRDAFTLPIDMEALGIFPHMHLLGREIKVTAHPPVGEPFSLLWINDWDFNWQNFYQYSTPVSLPAGTRITLEAVHDNSPENVRNPSRPPKRVVWGEQTVDEMSAAMLQLVPIREEDMAKFEGNIRKRVLGEITTAKAAALLAKKPSPPPGEEARQALAKFDRDKDGKLSIDELVAAAGIDKEKLRFLITPFDKDGDSLLNEAELAAAIGVLKGR